MDVQPGKWDAIQKNDGREWTTRARAGWVRAQIPGKLDESRVPQALGAEQSIISWGETCGVCNGAPHC